VGAGREAMNPGWKEAGKLVLPRRPGMGMSLGRIYFRIVADLLIHRG